MKYLKSYNESIKNYLKPKLEEEILKGFENLTSDDIFKKSLEFNLLYGFKYLIDNNLVDENTKYIIEKYKFDLHQDEIKDYEKWFLEQLTDLKIKKSEEDEYILIYQKDGIILFNYDNKNNNFYYNHHKIDIIFKTKFKLNDLGVKILVKGMVEEYLKIKVNHRKIHLFDLCNHIPKVQIVMNLFF